MARKSVQLQKFLEKFPTRVFKKGEIIIFQGEAPRSAFAIKSGIVKAYNLSTAGDEKPIGFITPLEVFPRAWVYSKVPSAIYYYEAFSESVTVYMVNREEFVDFIRQHPDTLFEEFERLALNELGQQVRLNALQHSRASDKLLYTLHYLALSHGRPTVQQQIEITLDLTHQDFANLTGLTRETAATELNKLKHRGVISYGKHTLYRLNLSKLMSLLNDQYIADLKVKL